MALVVKDRVKQDTTTTGTGTITLSGSYTGFDTFSEIGNTNTTYYVISDRFSGGVSAEDNLGPCCKINRRPTVGR